jgi:hypothetical protein
MISFLILYSSNQLASATKVTPVPRVTCLNSGVLRAAMREDRYSLDRPGTNPQPARRARLISLMLNRLTFRSSELIHTRNLNSGEISASMRPDALTFVDPQASGARLPACPEVFHSVQRFPIILIDIDICDHFLAWFSTICYKFDVSAGASFSIDLRQGSVTAKRSGFHLARYSLKFLALAAMCIRRQAAPRFQAE